MTLNGARMAAALGRIEAKLDAHIEHSKDWQARTDRAIANLAQEAQRLDQLRNRGIGLLAGVAIAGGAVGSVAAARLRTVLGLG